MGGSDADVGGRLVAHSTIWWESVRGLAREPQPVQPAPWEPCRRLRIMMDRKIDVDLRTHNRINEISSRLDELGRLLGGEQRPLENDQP